MHMPSPWSVSLALVAPVGLVLFAEPLAPRRLLEGLPHLSSAPGLVAAGGVSPHLRWPLPGPVNGYFGARRVAVRCCWLARTCRRSTRQ